MDEIAPDRDPLEALAEEFTRRQRAGESPSVEEYVARHPNLAEGIRELFPAIVAMERLKARRERTSGGSASLGPVQLERLGDFRIIREIGRGGMGIVFAAEQESLGRRVALKVLPRQALLEKRHLARFEREAQIASRLHHTNIVQVYGVGEQEGFHYYVMQYVRGVGLERVVEHLRAGGAGAGDETVADGADAPSAEPALLETVCARLCGGKGDAPSSPAGPAYWRSVAGVGEQVAEALAYAHEQGTLHRDIKPANLLLDEKGVVWVTDFGLARATTAPDVTAPGDLTGTLRYMAPERLRGQVSAQGDIYSLGLTLYEMLLLRPAYDQTDRSALMQQVAHHSPDRPRKVNPAIPRDLETVVLKAIARRRQDRYRTAGDLAADLRRFLEDRPVHARRVGPAGRLWRWGRRNKALAALAAASIVLLAAVAVTATVGYLRTRKALDSEARQRQRAEAVTALALEAVDRVFQRLGPVQAVRTSSLTVGGSDGTTVEVAAPPVVSKAAAALLEELLPFYARLAEQSGQDLALRLRSADATRRIGAIRQVLGQYDQAVAAYAKAIEMYRQLAEEGQGDGARFVILTAATLNELGRTHRLTGELDKADDAHKRAIDLLAAAADAPPAARYELARAYYFLGSHVRPAPGERPRGGERPRAPGRGMPPPPPDGLGPGRPPPPPDRRPRPPGRLPGEDRAGPDRQRRLGYLDKATALLDGLIEEEPDNPVYRHLLALCYREGRRVDREGPRQRMDRAIEILESLARDYPRVPQYRFDLSETYAMVDLRRPSLGRERLGELTGRLRKALEISQQLAKQYPNVPEYRAAQAHVCHKLGALYRQGGRPGDGEAYDRQAVTVQESLAGEFPDVAIYQVWLAAFRNSLADVLLRDSPAETRSIAEANIARTTALLEAHPELWYLHALLMDTNRTLADALRRTGQQDLAEQASRRAQAHRAKLDAHHNTRRPRGPATDE